jgi:hypothetical protein
MKTFALITAALLGAAFPASGQTPSAERPVEEILEGNLLKANGEGEVSPVDVDGLRGVRFFLFYYGAGWSGASVRLNPQLVRIHAELREKGVPVEFIYMSGERTPEELDDILTRAEMPWPAVEFGKVDAVDEAIRYGTREIPTLVLYSADGRRLSDTYVGGEFIGPAHVIQDLYRLTGANEDRESPSAPTAEAKPPAEKAPSSGSPSGTDFDSFFK